MGSTSSYSSGQISVWATWISLKKSHALFILRLDIRVGRIVGRARYILQIPFVSHSTNTGILYLRKSGLSQILCLLQFYHFCKATEF